MSCPLRFLLLVLAALAALSAPAAAQTPYYLRSNVGKPWGSSTNEQAMDAVFGANAWTNRTYEEVDEAALFATPRFIFMEGSDTNADELEAFVNANRAAIDVFLRGGGVIFFNAGAGEGDGMAYPDGSGGSVAYDRNALCNLPCSSAPTTAPVPGHPIFAGPFATATSFGPGFHRGFLSGAGIAPILVDGLSRSVLAERAVGPGLAVYGSMSDPIFHTPQPEAIHLRRNILAYAAGQVRPIGAPHYLRTISELPWGLSSNEAAMNDAFGAGKWVDERYETVNVAELFAIPRFVFMEGGQFTSDELESFLHLHRYEIDAFLARGGVIFANAAPIEGDGIAYPGGTGASVALTLGSCLNCGDVGPTTTAVPGHAIFAGPFTTQTSFTGDALSFGILTGTGFTSLLDNERGESVLAERSVQLGRALYGSLTPHTFHTPRIAARALRANIATYGTRAVHRVADSYYLRSSVGLPWGFSGSNEEAMDAVFGASWVDERYETVNVGTLFSTPRFIFMEGGDTNADELEAFLAANLAAINTFLASGGVIFFNAAALEGDGMAYPDGIGASIALNFEVSSCGNGPTTTPVPGHAIFAGPFPTAPGVGAGFTSFSHGFVTGSGIASVIDDGCGRSVLAERTLGPGRALYGAMTIAHFHDQHPEAENLRRNLLAYGASQVSHLPEPTSPLALALGVALLAALPRYRAR
jgi:hypothetical protein